VSEAGGVSGTFLLASHSVDSVDESIGLIDDFVTIKMSSAPCLLASKEPIRRH
jgi:hypothetical protein